MRLIILFLCLILHLGWGATAVCQEPEIIYLTWLGDPTTTMTIQWHTPEHTASQLSYKKSHETEWILAKGSSVPFGTSLVHTLELKELKPDTLYHFKLDETLYPFKTLPTTLESRPVQFAVAGDAYMHFTPFTQINAQIAAKDPDFVIIGGDIAYANGQKSLFSNKKWKIKRWQTFLRSWTKQMVASDGRLIPMLIILGNHDIHEGREKPIAANHDFFTLFAMPPPLYAYRSYIFGNYLGLTLLDTGHFSPISGEQTEWLRKTLKSHSLLPYRIAAYHMAAYPAVYRSAKETPLLIQKNWTQLFEQYRLQAAFEHHNHAFKRTHPIKNGRIDPTGVTYLGDGCWGVSPRKPRSPSQIWYLNKSAKVNHFWQATLTHQNMTLEAFDSHGKLLDQLIY